MGMAASQARYLQLSARKTNIEYEGQQINQQRTQLANESAGLFNKLMELKVPTAPSTSDYTTTQYKFNNGANECTITAIADLAGDPNYNKLVTYYHTETIQKGIGKTRNDLGVVGTGTTADPYWFTDGTTTKKTKLTQCDDASTDRTADYDAILQICKDNATSTLRTTCGYIPATGALTTVNGAYKYKSTDGITYYYSSSDLAAATSTDGHTVNLTGYYSAQLDQKVYNSSKRAYVENSDSGRYSDITLEDYSTSFNLNATTTTDSNAYNDAINEYEYQQTLYEQQVASINAKTSIIQAEDRTLELKLAQCDTEQKALSTELDSVKKVIDKNIEQTFKTFQ